MLRLALPTIAVLVVQTGVGVAETYFVSGLGTAALAGVTQAFPMLMLMQMMSNGGIGGGVSTLFQIVALAAIFYGVLTAASMLAGARRTPRATSSPSAANLS